MKSRVQDCRKCRQQIHDEEAEKYLKKEYSYYADFDYYTADGEHVVEDVKGYKGSTTYTVFKIKKKLMLYFHNIQVREV